MSVWDYKDQPSVWTRGELKKIARGETLGKQQRERQRKKEVWGVHPYQSKSKKK